MAQISCYEKQTVVNNGIPKESCKFIHPFKSYAEKATQIENKFLDTFTRNRLDFMTKLRGVIQSKRKSAPHMKKGQSNDVEFIDGVTNATNSFRKLFQKV